jgi:hypothetical protein
MDEIFKDTQEQIDTFYKCALGLMLEDYKTKGITIEQAERLYERYHIATIYKNGKVEFIYE